MNQDESADKEMGQGVKINIQNCSIIFADRFQKIRSLYFVSVLALTCLVALGGFSMVQAQEYVLPGLSPVISPDGLTAYGAVQPLIVITDPNPEMQGIKTMGLTAAHALTVPEAAVSTYLISFVAAGGTDLWGEPCFAFPAAAQSAFNAAAAIWANTLQSSVPVTIKACWANLGSSSILGYSGGQPLSRDFSGAPRANTWYEGSLANAIAGYDLDPSSYDMNITYNSGFSWYYGTDGNPPAGQYDLVSVAAHEICHGLNFSGSAFYSAGIGSYGYSGYPVIYDLFMESGTGTPLTSYTNGSAALGTLLTSNNLWFNGTNANAANGGMRLKMYAPGTWSGGSSYAHLDYATFAGTSNSLMVYAIGSGSANHEPGAVTVGLLADLGWQTGSGVNSDLSVSMTDTPDPVQINQQVTYNITVVNNGPDTGTGVTLSDTLPAGSAYVSHASSQGACTPAGNTLSCSIGTMANGASVTVAVVVTAPDTAGSIMNTATVSGASQDPVPGNNSSSATTTVTSAGTLSVTPSTGLISSGTQGGPFSPASVTYTLQNVGVTPINWTATKGQAWVTLSSISGTLAASESTSVTVSINSGADSLTAGGSAYLDSINFTNTTNGNGNTTRTVSLTVNTSSFPQVTVLTPNGGETLMAGSVYPITWGAPVNAVRFSLYYSLNDGSSWKAIATNVEGTHHDWTVPAQTANKKNCLIMVIGYNGSGGQAGIDRSDLKFTIEVINVMTPNGGESWSSGTVHPITWETGTTIKPLSRVNLYYKIDATGYHLITSFTGSNPGTYNWTVPAVTSKKAASRIKVELLYTGITAKGSDTSDANLTISP